VTRLEVLEHVIMCRRCELHSVGNGPLPFSGQGDAAFAVLGEAPNRAEDDKGHPFLGSAGKHLESELMAAGLDLDRGFFCNAVSCFPNGSPTPAQVGVCRPNMLAQLALSGTAPVLLVGSTALRSFRSDLNLNAAHGHVFMAEGRVMLATFHPALRNKLTMVQADLARFVQIMRSGGGWASHILNRCVMCETPEEQMEAQHIDGAGLLYCQTCWPTSPGGQEAKRVERVDPDPVAPFQRHSPTSKAAASEVDPTTATLREQVFAHLQQRGPMTDEALQDALGMNANTERPRRIELVEAGRVHEVDQTGRTRAGRSAVRWGVGPGAPVPVQPAVPVTEAQAVAMVQIAFPGAEVVPA
jgi:uracil-DNA glycosylase family 4